MNLRVLTWLSDDGRLILAARIIRTFGYGFLSVILSIYLALIGFNGVQIGLILSTSLINSILFNVIASYYADKLGRRNLLIIYSLLMFSSGIIFFVTDNYIALIVAAFIGTINVTGSETSAFLSIEQAILPRTINDYKEEKYAVCHLQFGWNSCNVCRDPTVRVADCRSAIYQRVISCRIYENTLSHL